MSDVTYVKVDGSNNPPVPLKATDVGQFAKIYVTPDGEILVSGSGGGGGSGTVTSVSVASANGVTGTVATATSTPAITLEVTRTQKTITQNAHGFSAGQAVYNNNGTWTLTDADALTSSFARGVIESVTTNTFVLVMSGAITLSGLTANSTYYLSQTAGALTTTPPTDASSYVTPVLFTGTTTQGYVTIGQPTSNALISLTADVSGILPTANGGTGIAYFTAAGPTAARVYTFPDSNATIARTDTDQTFSGTQTFGITTVFGDGSSGILAVIKGGAGQNRVIDFRSVNSSRWKVLADSSAESGSDAGSAFLVNAYTDSGVFIDSPIAITRAASGQFVTSRIFHTSNTTTSSSTSTGSGIFGGGVGVAGALYVGGVINVAGHATLEGVTSTGATGTGALMFGTNPSLTVSAPGTTTVGYLGVPQNSQSAAYTTVMSDAGKEIFHPSSDNNARTFTIDSNANVAYPIGTVIIFTNMAAANLTIAITSDTMNLLGAGTTGSRTLAQYGSAAARKISSTGWIISGVNLT